MVNKLVQLIKNINPISLILKCVIEASSCMIVVDVVDGVQFNTDFSCVKRLGISNDMLFLNCRCDLAGSERLKKTQAEGERLSEAQHINSSLLELG